MFPLTSAAPCGKSSGFSSSASSPLLLLPLDAVATNSFLHQYPAVKKSTQQLQLRKPRHPKRPQLPPGEDG